MIDERMEELASLHVLGALSGTEARQFRKAMQASPELQELVARLSRVTGVMAGAVPLIGPPPQLRAVVLAQAAPRQRTAALPPPKFRAALFLPWAFAVCLAILCAVLSTHENQLRQRISAETGQIGAMNQLAQTLQAATNDLQRTVAALQETNRLVNLRIAMLNSLVADAPKTVAVTLWDNQKQDGVFVAQNLKALPSDEDYELWVIDENQQPVAAGVFHVEANGSVRMEFKPGRLIKTAGTFAVTQEIKGGVASPTLKNMVLAGN
jgi:anti-sigma-K factor RskA